MNPQSRIAIKLKTSAERHVSRRHPWIFDESIVKQSKEGVTGDLAIIFSNAKNKFLALGLFDAESPVRIKVLSWTAGEVIDADWLKAKISTAWEARRPMLNVEQDSCRVLFGENDGLPGLIVDKYGGVLVLKMYSGIWHPYLDTLVSVLVDLVEPKCIVLRLSRHVGKLKLEGLSEGRILYGELASPVIQFKEHGVVFETDVVEGHKTGFFLDHRDNRYALQSMAKGKTVLDVFAYSGGFSTHALVGGAREVTSIDISAQALKLAERNASLNSHNGVHSTICKDAFVALEQLRQAGRTYDIVVIDPPSFAKAASEIDKAIISYGRLAAVGAKLVKQGGYLMMASCSSRVIADVFFNTVNVELDGSGNTFVLERQTFHAVDHPIGFEQGAYLKCGYWRRTM